MRLIITFNAGIKNSSHFKVSLAKSTTQAVSAANKKLKETKSGRAILYFSSRRENRQAPNSPVSAYKAKTPTSAPESSTENVRKLIPPQMPGRKPQNRDIITNTTKNGQPAGGRNAQHSETTRQMP